MENFEDILNDFLEEYDGYSRINIDSLIWISKSYGFSCVYGIYGSYNYNLGVHFCDIDDVIPKLINNKIPFVLTIVCYSTLIYDGTNMKIIPFQTWDEIKIILNEIHDSNYYQKLYKEYRLMELI